MLIKCYSNPVSRAEYVKTGNERIVLTSGHGDQFFVIDARGNDIAEINYFHILRYSALLERTVRATDS